MRKRRENEKAREKKPACASRQRETARERERARKRDARKKGIQVDGQTCSDPLHRYEFGPPKFFSKTFKFSMIFYSTWQISRGGQ